MFISCRSVAVISQMLRYCYHPEMFVHALQASSVLNSTPRYSIALAHGQRTYRLPSNHSFEKRCLLLICPGIWKSTCVADIVLYGDWKFVCCLLNHLSRRRRSCPRRHASSSSRCHNVVQCMIPICYQTNGVEHQPSLSWHGVKEMNEAIAMAVAPGLVMLLWGRTWVMAELGYFRD